MRVRTRGVFENRISTRDNYYLWDGKTSVLQPVRTLMYPDAAGVEETMTDVSTPNFGKLAAAGGIVNTPMSRRIHVRDLPGTSFTGRTLSGRSHAVYANDYILSSIGLPLPKAPDTGLLQDLRRLAATKARAGVESPTVQGQVSLMELIKTLRMLRRPFTGLNNYIEGWLRRRQNPRYAGGPRAIKTVADCWLEGRYGWRPFIMEVESLIEVLLFETYSKRKTSRAMQERSVRSTATFTDAGTAGGTFLVDMFEVYTQEYSVRSGILYESHLDLQGALGMRWADIPDAAWELIPFSFVVDWFLNVGNVIQALVPKAGTNYLAEFETVRTKCTVTRSFNRIRGSADWNYTIPSGDHVVSIETIERVPKVSPAGLVLTLDLSEALKGARVFDAIGLITSKMRQSRRSFTSTSSYD